MTLLQRTHHFLDSLTRPNPMRDWGIALILLFVPFVLFTLYAGYLFLGIQSGFIIRSNAVPFPAQTVTTDEIQSVLDVYRARKTLYDAHGASVLPIVELVTSAGQ